MKITEADKKRVKAMGCLFNRESEDEFNVRVITENGTLTGAQLANIAEAADQFGSGTVAFTTRLTVEISGVKYEDIPALQAHLARTDLETGGTGAKVRPVTACKGTTCVFGQINTQAIAKQIHKRFYEGYKDVVLPHKFKIAVGGCPNNCMKPDLNDFGLIGQNKPLVNWDKCRGCKKCIVQEGCQRGAAKVVDGKITIDKERCNACGKCIRNCYFKSLSSQAHGVKIVIGGRWGREGRKASELPGIYSAIDAMDILEKTLLAYRHYGRPRERFGLMVERLGMDRMEELLLTDEVLRKKEQILAEPVGAGADLQPGRA